MTRLKDFSFIVKHASPVDLSVNVDGRAVTTADLTVSVLQQYLTLCTAYDDAKMAAVHHATPLATFTAEPPLRHRRQTILPELHVEETHIPDLTIANEEEGEKFCDGYDEDGLVVVRCKGKQVTAKCD